MAKEGEVTYELRGDDSNLDSDLAKAEKKVEEHAKKTSDSTIKAEKEATDAIKKEREKVTKHHEKEVKKQEKTEQTSAKTFKGLAKEVSADVKKRASDIKSSATKAITAIRHPVKTVASFSKEKAQTIRRSFKESFQKTKENAVSGMRKVANAMLHPVDTAKSAAANIKNSFSKAMDSMSPMLKKLGKAGAGAIGAGFMAAGTAVVAVGASAVKSAVSMDKAVNSFITSTGKGKEEAERYQGVLEKIYKNNYGESFEDIAGAMEKVSKTFGDVDDTTLQGLTESAFALRDTFEYDVAESTRAAKAMMDNFGISGEKAMNLIATGAQNNLDFSGEMLDSINEYSVQFAKMGLDADDMFKIFQKGAETGAWNIDKIGDAVKEMSIRVIDGSETTKAGFEAIGLNADEMASKFSKGGESAKEAFQQTIAAIAAMEDPLEQNIAGTNLFGTMWEDLGPEVVTQLASIGDAAYATGDELYKIKQVKYDDLESMFEGLKRSVELLLIPLGEELIPVLSELIEAVMPIIEEVLPPFSEAIGELVTALAPLIEEALPFLTETIAELLPLFMEIINSILPVLAELLEMLLPPIMEIVSSVLPVLLELINALLPIFSTLITLLQPIIDLFMQLLAPILNLISQALVPLINSLTPLISILVNSLIPVLNFLGSVFSSVFSNVIASASGAMGNLTSIFKEILSFIKNVFAGNWKGAWENIKNIFKNIVEGLGNIFKIPLNAIIDLINGFIEGINEIEIPEWVPGVGGMGFNIPTIPRLRVGMDYVPSDDFPAFLHKGEAVLTAQENALYQANGGIAGVVRSLERPAARTPGEIDYDRLGKAVADAMPDTKLVISKGAIEGEVSIDGKRTGRVLAPVIDQELGEIQRRKERS